MFNNRILEQETLVLFKITEWIPKIIDNIIVSTSFYNALHQLLKRQNKFFHMLIWDKVNVIRIWLVWICKGSHVLASLKTKRLWEIFFSKSLLLFREAKKWRPLQIQTSKILKLYLKSTYGRICFAF